MKVIIINGAPRVGKDTFIKLLREIRCYDVIAEYSSIDWVKDLAKDAFDWDGTKDAKSRQLLSDLKDLATAWDDIPFREICKEILRAKINWCWGKPADYFCTNIREPQEIQKLVDWCKLQKIPCYSVWIRRAVAEEEAAKDFLSSGDTQYRDYGYDWIIHNDSELCEFKEEIQKRLNFIKEIA